MNAPAGSGNRFREAGCDAVRAEGIRSLDWLTEINALVDCPVVFNQMAGGKSPVCSLSELRTRGACMVIYSTPCLFAAQNAVEKALLALRAEDGLLAGALIRDATLTSCNAVLQRNLNPLET